jgi:hypothetical protein
MTRVKRTRKRVKPRAATNGQFNDELAGVQRAVISLEERVARLEAVLRTFRSHPRTAAEIAAAQMQTLAGEAHRKAELQKRQDAARRGQGSKVSAREEAERRIREIVERGSSPPVRDELFATLSREIHGLSERQFLAAWTAAAPASWKRPGAKRDRS